MGSILRVGLLLDSVGLPAWAFTAIERMVASDCAQLTLVVLNQSRASRSLWIASRWELAHSLYRVFNTIDEKLFIRGQNALTKVNASEVFSKVPVIHVRPIGEDGQQFFSPSDVRTIKSYQLDILVKMGFGNLQGDVLSAATYGIWRYRWGDANKIEDGLTGFWEVIEGWPETGAALQRLGASVEQDVTLFESWFFTYPYSPARSRNYILWSAASFLPRQVERLHLLGGERYFQEIKNKADKKPMALHTNLIPSNLVVLWVMLKLIFRNFKEVFRRTFYRERWELLFRYSQDAEIDIPALKKISPPSDRFWADPHLIYKEPSYYIFVEEYLYRAKKGHISVIEMDRQGHYKQPVPVLQADCHLSFPCVFEWLGCYYMIPESSGKKTIDLYECIRFPDQWKLIMTLMKEVKAVDTTVVYQGGKWWLFTAIAEQEAAAPQFELFLFYSNELFTDQWQAHSMNPVVSDVKKARAAGRIFEKDGRLFRPSQYGSSAYGYGFDLNEIAILSETEYSERTITSVRPDSMKRIIATHTYARQGILTIVDALTLQPRWANTPPSYKF